MKWKTTVESDDPAYVRVPNGRDGQSTLDQYKYLCVSIYCSQGVCLSHYCYYALVPARLVYIVPMAIHRHLRNTIIRVCDCCTYTNDV